jgi:hypothetical protein
MHLLTVYFLFVGLPMLGIVGLLEAGRSLRAPRSVAGRWEIRSDLSPLAHTPCADLVKSVRQPALTITQSGSMLSIVLNNESATTLNGRIDQNIVTADFGESLCSLNAELRNQPQRTTLTGVVSAKCRGCAPVAFEGIRLPSKRVRL